MEVSYKLYAPATLFPWKNSGRKVMVRCVGPTVDLDALGKTTVYCVGRESNQIPRLSGPYPTQYSD
jgi:hypothetical protein